MTLRIDTHQHFWRFVPEKYDWISTELGALRRDYTPADLKPELDRARIDATVAVEARGHLEETESLLRHAAQNAFVRGVVGWLPLMQADVQRHIELYTQQPKLKGVRHWMGPASDLDFMTSEALHRGVALLEAAGLTYDLMLWPPQLGVVRAFVDRHPKQRFVLDHFAKPYIKNAMFEPWGRELRELAQRPNVYCKLSGLTTEADHARWTIDDLRPYVDAALEAFGPARLMFGSDWPVCTLATGYGRWVETVEALIASLSEAEQGRIMGGTAIEAYRL